MVQVAVVINAPINYVEAIRDYGWKVKFSHYRRLEGEKEVVPLGVIRSIQGQEYIEPYGGVTVCSAKKEVNGSIIEVRAEAHCNKTDKYVKKEGNFLAAQRLWEFIHE